MSSSRTYRAGGSVEDYCRACKTDRMHTVIVVDGEGQPLRVACGYCDSEHNYRGGPRIETSPVVSITSGAPPRTGASAAGASTAGASRRTSGSPMPVVTDRERAAPPIMVPDSTDDFELLLRRIIREEAGVSSVVPAEKWRGGTLVLRPANPALQEKSWPIETFFHKIVIIRNRLRTLEQQVNASALPDEVKIKLQGYVSGCYGSLTSFNVLFADDDDQFRGGSD